MVYSEMSGLSGYPVPGSAGGGEKIQEGGLVGILMSGSSKNLTSKPDIGAATAKKKPLKKALWRKPQGRDYPTNPTERKR